jgi:fibronectin-binding autotransporter adhesin
MSSELNKAFFRMRRALLLLLALTLCSSSVAPLMNIGSVYAATLSQRSLQIGSGTASVSTSYTFSFVPNTSAAIQGLEFQACTTALGTCTAPSGLSFSSAAGGSLTGSWTNATAFTVDATGANNCIASASVLCAKRTQAASETGTSPRGVNFTGVINPNGSSCSTTNCTFFVRMTTYSLTTYTAGSTIDTGSVASSTVQTLTVSATIQEQLSFCIGNTTVDNATSTVPLCSSITGTSLNLGTLSSSNISVSPVSTSNNGDANNGLAELSTNASNGANITYGAIQQTGTYHLGTLRVAGATCNVGTVNTDQCINAAGVSKSTLTAGTEKYGMAISGVNCSEVTAYTCSFSTGTFNLVPTTNYNCNGIVAGSADTYTTDANLVSGTTACSYAWDETGTSETVATSSTVVANEALILKFAATPNLVTPTGSYTAKANFVATPTF